MEESIKRLLYQLNSQEKIQKETGQFVMDYPNDSFSDEGGSMYLLSDYFFSHQEISVSKHNRYADYPYHSHQFLELNYVLSGEFQQVIEGNEEVIQEGELLLLGPGCRHSIKATGDNDILINILFCNQHITTEWFTDIEKRNSMVYDFLLSSTINANQNKYIIFKSANIPHIQQILEQMITEYYRGEEYSAKMISLYMPILFTELVRKCDQFLSDKEKRIVSESNRITLNTLQLIKKNFRDITLDSAAQTLGYNKNYLSNLIKKRTGLTFTELVNKQKVLSANLLIESTNLPINHIIEQVGFSNKTYFYRLYKEHYQLLPSEIRRAAQ